jgi:hypothetical protein
MQLDAMTDSGAPAVCITRKCACALHAQMHRALKWHRRAFGLLHGALQWWLAAHLAIHCIDEGPCADADEHNGCYNEGRPHGLYGVFHGCIQHVEAALAAAPVPAAHIGLSRQDVM